MNTRSSKLSLAAILDTSIGGCMWLATVIMTVHLQPPMEFALGCSLGILTPRVCLGRRRNLPSAAPKGGADRVRCSCWTPRSCEAYARAHEVVCERFGWSAYSGSVVGGVRSRGRSSTTPSPFSTWCAVHARNALASGLDLNAFQIRRLRVPGAWTQLCDLGVYPIAPTPISTASPTC